MALVVGEPEDTPLQEKLGGLAAAISKAGLAVAVISFVVLMTRCALCFLGVARLDDWLARERPGVEYALACIYKST